MTKLQAIRKKRGLSQFELAKYSDVSIQAIQKYEQNSMSIDSCRISSLLRIAKVLNVSFLDLLESEFLRQEVEEQLIRPTVQGPEG